MASSRVMASSSSANSELTRQSSIYSLTIAELQSSISADPAKNFGSMSMEDFLRNLYGEGGAAASPFAGGGDPGGVGAAAEGSVSRQGSFTLPKGVESKTVEEVWREISAVRKVDTGGGGEEPDTGEMTLEDFLAKAGAVMEEDLGGVFAADSVMQQQLPPEIPVQLFGSGGGEGRGGGRGRKRPLLDPEDRSVLQRQKRMIKNRESAARSRERKQAYTVELESLVTQLEEENSQLTRHQEEQNMKRLKQLLENVIPITEKRKPPRLLRRTQSVQW